MRVFDSGVLPGADVMEIKRTRLTNIVSLASPIIIAPVWMFYLREKNYVIVGSLVLASLSYLASFFLNRWHWKSAARMLLMFTAVMSTGFGAVILGRTAMVQCITIACVQLPFLLFQEDRKFLLWVSIIAICIAYAGTELLMYTIDPITEFRGNEMQLNYHLNMTMLLVCLCVFVKFLYGENQRAVHSEKRQKEIAEKLLADIRSDLNAARRIQQSLMPSLSLDFRSAHARIWSCPVQEVGGDFYNCRELSDGKIRVFFGDAMGHGVQAALMTMAIRTEYDAIFDRIREPIDLVTALNRQFYAKYKNLNTYATCIVMDIRPETREVEFVSAGHPAQILLHHRGFTEMDSTGPAIGIIANASYRSRKLDFNPVTDGIILYTDGLIESNNPQGEMFGEERFFKILLREQGENPERIAEACMDAFLEFLGRAQPQDDVMVMSLAGKA